MVIVRSARPCENGRDSGAVFGAAAPHLKTSPPNVSAVKDDSPFRPTKKQFRKGHNRVDVLYAASPLGETVF
jgi:hypothetical protein